LGRKPHGAGNLKRDSSLQNKSSSLALFVGTVIAIRRQVLEEEACLSRTYGDDYRAYAIRAGRFVPGMGRFN
jgi:protein-S-isoprenylcysteine O-methyltransferase Ste14